MELPNPKHKSDTVKDLKAVKSILDLPTSLLVLSPLCLLRIRASQEIPAQKAHSGYEFEVYVYFFGYYRALSPLRLERPNLTATTPKFVKTALIGRTIWETNGRLGNGRWR